jgi:hypothetical protein
MTDPAPPAPAADPVAAEPVGSAPTASAPATAATAPEPSPIPPPVPFVVPPAPRVRRGRGWGGTSFTLGLLAVLGDIAFVVVVIVSLVNFDGDFTAGLGLFFVALVLLTIVFWGGLIFGGLSILFGIIGLVRGSGRVLAVVGIVLSVAVVAVNLLLGWGLISGGDGLVDQWIPDGLIT